MDYENLKKAVQEIKMPAEMQMRITERCRAAAAQQSPPACAKAPGKWKRRSIRLAAAAAVCVICCATAVAVGGHLFYNPTIVPTPGDATAATVQSGAAPSLSGLAKPNSGTPHSLADMTESYSAKSRGWDSENTIGGSVSSIHETWISMTPLESKNGVRARLVTGKSGAVKTEYTAENPDLLQSVLPEQIAIDTAWLNETYQYVPDANCAYIIEDKKGAYAGSYFSALYAADDESAWFGLEYSNAAQSDQDESNSFVAESDYDNVYTYTTESGAEFLIQTYGDCAWLSCTTASTSIQLYGGYLTCAELEQIAEHLDVTLPAGDSN